jgi:hypothetical protein
MAFSGLLYVSFLYRLNVEKRVTQSHPITRDRKLLNTLETKTTVLRVNSVQEREAGQIIYGFKEPKPCCPNTLKFAGFQNIFSNRFSEVN